MKRTRRSVIGTLASVGSIAVAGCVNENLVDTTYECKIEEPKNIPTNSQPTLGRENALVEVSIYHDYSRGTSKVFAQNTLERLITEYVETGKAKLVFHDALVEEEEPWGYDLASVGRYLYAEHGQEAYQNYLLSIYTTDDEVTWQLVGDIAAKVSADPCTTISHGSWKTYKKEIDQNKQDALNSGISESPAVTVNGDRVEDMSPLSETYEPIASKIDSELEFISTIHPTTG